MTQNSPDLNRVAATRLALLQSLTAKLAAARTAEAVAAVIMTDGLATLDAEVGVVALLSADGRTLTNVGFEGVSQQTRGEWESYSVDSPVPVADAARTGEAVVVASREERNRRYPVLAAVHGPENGGPVIALPLRIADRTGGVLAFCFPDIAAFERHEIDFFRALADQCALALERSALEADLRREQKALRDREARLNLIHESAGIGAWEWDAATNEVYWSDQYRELYGLQPDELPRFERGIGQVLEEDRERTLAAFAAALDSAASFRSEHRIRHPQKGLRWIAASGKVLRGASGGVERMVGIVLDITELKATEIAAQDNASRFRGLMEQAPFSVQVLAPDGRTLQVNAAWCKLWSASFDQLADYNILSDPQLEAQGILPYIRRAFAGEAVEIPEVCYDPRQIVPDLPAEDTVRWVSAIAYPRKDETGALREVVLIHRDVTAERRSGRALRDSEEKFRLMADTIPQLAWMANPGGHIFWFNHRWYEYTGTTPGDSDGWGWKSVHDPEVLPEVVRTWQQTLATGEPFEMVFPLRGADGAFRPFLTQVNPLRGEGGQILYWFGTNTDVSQIKRLELELLDADRRKDEFLATLAHELRNPLAPIRNALEILSLPGVEVSMQTYAREVMSRQLHHLSRLVDDLLDVSRVMRGKIELRRETVAVSTLISRAIETVQPLIRQCEHALEVLTAGGDVWHVDGDPERLVQVLSNLLTNSAKYTPRGGRIAIECRAEGETVIVKISDNGIGIGADVLPKVFELFVQGEHPSVKASSGLGIGLTLVKNIVELHGGSVAVHSDGTNRGTAVEVRLPLREPAFPRASPAVERPPVLRSARILVVDDNRDAADSLVALLNAMGHEVKVAYDGQAALTTARAQFPELVLLDIGMPDMDGYEVARRLRSITELRGTRIVALTGWGQEADLRRTAQAGFDQHLVKPLRAGAIEELIRNLSDLDAPSAPPSDRAPITISSARGTAPGPGV